jgi:DnaJ-class molecular chaperone
MSDFEITDRYRALGIPYPDPETMCKGQCEGTGVVPTEDEHGEWQFLKCEECNGTGKLVSGAAA